MSFVIVLDVTIIKMSQEAHVWLPAVCQTVKQVYIDHTPCGQLTKRQLL
jgi:hypothetical protein